MEGREAVIVLPFRVSVRFAVRVTVGESFTWQSILAPCCKRKLKVSFT